MGERLQGVGVALMIGAVVLAVITAADAPPALDELTVQRMTISAPAAIHRRARGASFGVIGIDQVERCNCRQPAAPRGVECPMRWRH